MVKKDFFMFMRSQVKEIRNYQKTRLNTCPDANLNDCAFEWIENYAFDFRKNWKEDKYNK